MICYRDMTFCEAKCANAACTRKLTDEVRAGARRWWAGFPGEAPIAVADRSDGCRDYQPDKTA